MAKTGRICGVCGDIGQIEKLVACSVNKIACEHTYFVQAPAPNQPGIWYCQTCRKKQTEMMEKRKSDKAGPTKRFENSKVKFLSSEEVISMSRGTVRQCIKTTTTSIASSIQTAPPSATPTPTPTQTQTSMAKSASERLLSAKNMLFREPGNASSSGSKEMGHKLSSLKGQLPYHLSPVWKGSLEVHDLVGNTLVELVAYLPLQASAKLYSAIEALPTKLQMKMVPHFNAWPKQFETDFPKLEDIGVYLLPSERGSGLKCTHLLRQLDSKKLSLKMNVNACLELVVYSSQILAENSQRFGGDLFFWGFFWKHKIRSGSKKNKFTTSDITPSKTSSDLGASSDIRTPIARDKIADVLKHNQVDKEVIADISDVCENNLWKKEVVADTLDVPPGFARPSIRQEISPMDRQSETSMQGKKTQPVYKEVAPGCSSLSHIANKGSGRKQFISSIGVGGLEATLAECENQEEYPGLYTAQCVTDTTSEKRADEAQTKRTSEQPNASQGIQPNLGGSEIAPETMPQQLDTPIGLGTSGQIFIKDGKEPLVPLPDGLEIPPGFSRKIEAREDQNVSSQQLETPPGFCTLGPILMKHEKEPLVPLPVHLEIPPGFSRRVEAREEKNVSNQQLETPPGFRTLGPILMKHEKEPLVPLLVGLEIPPGFSRKVEAREEKNVSNQQLETPPGFRTLGPILMKHEKEPLVPLPVGLEIPPGFSRRVEAREEKNISNQKLETPPGFRTLGPILIRHEKEPLALPVGLEIPPGFSRRVESREEKNISNESKSRPLSTNQGIVHQQTPDGLHTVVFSYPRDHNCVIHGTASESCSAQLTSPGGIHGNTSMFLFQGTSHRRAIPEVSLNHSQTIQVPPNHIQNYLEHNKSTYSMHATGEKQRAHSSFTTPNVKSKAFGPPDTDFTELYQEMRPKEASKNSKNNQIIESQREIVRQSPVQRRERSRSRSPVRRRERSRSRSPVWRRERSRSRSPVRRRERSRSRSPVRRRERSRSRSPVWRRRERSRSRSPAPRRHRSRSRSSPRWYWNPVYRRNCSRVRSPVRPSHSHHSGRYSSQHKSRCWSRSRGDSDSFDSSPSCRRGRNRSRSVSPPSS